MFSGDGGVAIETRGSDPNHVIYRTLGVVVRMRIRMTVRDFSKVVRRRLLQVGRDCAIDTFKIAKDPYESLLHAKSGAG